MDKSNLIKVDEITNNKLVFNALNIKTNVNKNDLNKYNNFSEFKQIADNKDALANSNNNKNYNIQEKVGVNLDKKNQYNKNTKVTDNNKINEDSINEDSKSLEKVISDYSDETGIVENIYLYINKIKNDGILFNEAPFDDEEKKITELFPNENSTQNINIKFIDDYSSAENFEEKGMNINQDFFQQNYDEIPQQNYDEVLQQNYDEIINYNSSYFIGDNDNEINNGEPEKQITSIINNDLKYSLKNNLEEEAEKDNNYIIKESDQQKISITSDLKQKVSNIHFKNPIRENITKRDQLNSSELDVDSKNYINSEENKNLEVLFSENIKFNESIIPNEKNIIEAYKNVNKHNMKEQISNEKGANKITSSDKINDEYLKEEFSSFDESNNESNQEFNNNSFQENRENDFSQNESHGFTKENNHFKVSDISNKLNNNDLNKISKTNDNEIKNQVFEQVKFKIKTIDIKNVNSTKIDVKLTPAELGNISVKIEVGKDQLAKLYISSDQNSTLQSLKETVDQLTKSLEEVSGIKFDNNPQFDLKEGNKNNTKQEFFKFSENNLLDEQDNTQNSTQKYQYLVGEDIYKYLENNQRLDIKV